MGSQPPPPDGSNCPHAPPKLRLPGAPFPDANLHRAPAVPLHAPLSLPSRRTPADPVRQPTETRSPPRALPEATGHRPREGKTEGTRSNPPPILPSEAGNGLQVPAQPRIPHHRTTAAQRPAGAPGEGPAPGSPAAAPVRPPPPPAPLTGPLAGARPPPARRSCPPPPPRSLTHLRQSGGGTRTRTCRGWGSDCTSAPAAAAGTPAGPAHGPAPPPRDTPPHRRVFPGACASSRFSPPPPPPAPGYHRVFPARLRSGSFPPFCQRCWGWRVWVVARWSPLLGERGVSAVPGSPSGQPSVQVCPGSWYVQPRAPWGWVGGLQALPRSGEMKGVSELWLVISSRNIPGACHLF